METLFVKRGEEQRINNFIEWRFDTPGWTILPLEEKGVKIWTDSRGQTYRASPDYWHDSEKILRLVERDMPQALSSVCASISPHTTDRWTVSFRREAPEKVVWWASHNRLASALCLALLKMKGVVIEWEK